MSQVNVCPDCKNALSARIKRCSCGWVKMECQEVAKTNHRCQCAITQRRCPLPGTISPYPAGSVWYCRRHYQTLGDLGLAEAALQYVEENLQKIIHEEYQDWRVTILNP